MKVLKWLVIGLVAVPVACTSLVSVGLNQTKEQEAKLLKGEKVELTEGQIESIKSRQAWQRNMFNLATQGTDEGNQMRADLGDYYSTLKAKNQYRAKLDAVMVEGCTDKSSVWADYVVEAKTDCSDVLKFDKLSKGAK